MDVDKLLRDSARVVNGSSLAQDYGIEQLEKRIQTRVMKPMKGRRPLFYVAIPLCLLLAFTWLFPQWGILGEQTLEQASSVLAGKETTLPSLSFSDDGALLKKITLEQVIVTPPYVKVAVDFDLAEQYWLTVDNPYLIDEAGRKYLFVREEELVDDEKYIYTFISERKFETAPNVVNLRIPTLLLRTREKIHNFETFTLTLDEKYPKTVSLEQMQFSVDSFTYTGNTLTLTISCNPELATTLWLNNEFEATEDPLEEINSKTLKYRYVVSKQDEYTFQVSPEPPISRGKAMRNLQLSSPIIN